MSEDERTCIYEDALNAKEHEINRLKAELKICQGELDWARCKLKEAQERNRKLDWVLTQTIEAL